ncbi:TPA: hypothetical protein ACXNPU_000508 [Proteus mirabilis]
MGETMMEKKLFDYNVLYNNGEEFFKLKGNACMYLSPKAAIEVCQEATKRNLWIFRYRWWSLAESWIPSRWKCILVRQN